jgi:hypothetical protein
MSEFSDNVNKLLKTVEAEALDVEVKKQKSTTGSGSPWQAGVVFDGKDGELTTKAHDAPLSNWDDELREWGFDPDLYEVVEPVRFSTWQTYDERQLWAYKAQIRSKSGLTSVELDSLTAPVKRDRRKPAARPSGKYTLVVPLGDWQIGKDDGDGLEGTVARIEQMFESVLDRVTYLRKSGYDIGKLLVLSLGDLGEGCNGHYEQQTFSVILDRRDQNKVVRRLARNALMKWATEFEEVTVAAVAGNHGENRRGSKSFTTTNDNDDVAIWEAVAETLSVAPDLYGHVKWLLPRGELSASLQVGGHIIGLAHGHQARSGDIGRWWQGQALGNCATADADILITGHFHHFKCTEVAKGRWHFQVPAMDGGSDWFQESTGRGSTAGQVTFLLSNAGWAELKII